MAKITLKYYKETEREHKHTRVYHNGILLGYFMRNNHALALKGENWNFESEHDSVKYFVAETYKETVETIQKQINKETVTLKQHFGQTETLFA